MMAETALEPTTAVHYGIRMTVFVGTPQNDTLNGSNTDDVLIGFGGDDSLSGQNGNDSLDGGEGSDTLIGGSGFDTLEGGDGYDVAVFQGPLSYFANSEIADAPVASGRNVIRDVEEFRGTSTNDHFQMFSATQTVQTLDGNDTIELQNTNLQVFAGSGDDLIITDQSTNSVDGGLDFDTLDLSRISAQLQIDLATGIATTGGSVSGDGQYGGGSGFLNLTNIESAIGGTGIDILRASSSGSRLDGGRGEDFLYGADGDDTLIGGLGRDTMFGNGGNDVFVPDFGDDLDVAVGFNAGVGGDVISFDNLLLIAGSIGWSPSENPFGSAGYLTLVQDGEHVLLQFDRDGSGGQYTFKSVLRIIGVELTDFVADNFSIAHSPSGSETIGESLIGTDANELLEGGYFNDTIDGAGGNDTILGNDGNDLIKASAGFDVVDGGGLFDFIDYSDFDGGVLVHLLNRYSEIGGFLNADGYYQSGQRKDELRSIEGAVGSEFADRLIGSNEASELLGRGGNDRITSFGRNDTLDGGEGNDTLEARGGDDSLTGGDGNDYVDAGAGNDTIFVTGGVDTIDGGVGSDAVKFDAIFGALEINIFNYTAKAGGSLNTAGLYAGGQDIAYLVSIEAADGSEIADRIVGARGNSTLFGHGGGDRITGLNGNDSLDGGLGDDTLDGGRGNDTLLGGGGFDHLTDLEGKNWLDGGAGDDTLESGDGSDTLFGGDGNDLIQGGNGSNVFLLSAGSDTIVGGTNNDAISYAATTQGWLLDLVTGIHSYMDGSGAGSVVLSSIENVVGSDFSDDLRGGPMANARVYGNGGDDILRGHSGTDLLNGGAGNDTVIASEGIDTYSGGDGTGNDVLDLSSSNSAILMLTRSGPNPGPSVLITSPEMEISASGFETFYASDFDDRIWAPRKSTVYGGSGNDLIQYDGLGSRALSNTNGGFIDGGEGNDTLTSYRFVSSDSGNSPAEWFKGGSGNDRLETWGSNDTLEGGTGDDTVFGGAGIDTFIFNHGDQRLTIEDFKLTFIIDDEVVDIYESFNVLRFVGFDNDIASFSDVFALATDDGTDTTIDLGGGDVIVLLNMVVSEFDSNDFLFG